MRNKLFTGIVVFLCILELVLVLVSWLLSASQAYDGVRSMISGEAVRWFFGGFSSMMSAEPLVWLLLLSMSAGCIVRCGVWRGSCRSGASPYRRRMALWLASASVVVFLSVYAAFAFAPHALLRSVTGELFPSPFSFSLIPSLSFAMLLFGVVYVLVSGGFRNMSSAVGSLLAGISSAAPLFLFYILLAQLYYSLLFVFG